MVGSERVGGAARNTIVPTLHLSHSFSPPELSQS